MRKLTLFSVLVFGGALLTSVGHADDIDVEMLWGKNCKKCHGANGAGDTRVGKKLGLRDYTDPAVQATFTDEEAIKVTMEGVTDDAGKEEMKPFADKLSEAEIHALVAYIRSFAQE